jgi:DNA-binding MarR family transcriptional regulator
MRRSIDEVLAPIGITSAQFDLLQQLLHEDGLEHRELQRRLGLTSPSLTTLVDGMVRNGHLARRPDPEDGRVKRIWLESKAVEIIRSEAFAQAGRTVTERLLAPFSTEEAARFLHQLDAVCESFGGT